MADILIDIDGVVLDTQASWLALYNADYDDCLTNEDIKGWDLVPFVKPECGSKIYDYLDRPDFYDATIPIFQAKWGVEQLRRKHRVRFVSAGFYPTKIACLHEFGFLVEFPYNDARWQTCLDAILINDKSWIKGDLLIDDRPKNLVEQGGTALLFNQPWNQDHHMHPRAFNWEDVVEMVGERYG